MIIRISDKVKNALRNNIPVVALESTIISHGMPYPKNVQTAYLLEETIEKMGVVPATIGIIDGVPVVGMSKEEIEEFGKRQGILKVSRRDLPYVIAQKKWGATTVATTMIFASKAGIDVFVTGGVGGVHREAEKTFDISADLIELASTPVTVVCAGVKAILDLPKTLEVLETLGVTVISYQSDNLADFYTPDSGLKVDVRMDEPLEIAQAMKVKKDFNLRGGLLISNPIEEDKAIDKEKVNNAINQALKELKNNNIHGKDCTPFLLKRVVELTQGESLESNIALVLHNAILGCQIAKEYMNLSLIKEKSCGAVVYKEVNGELYFLIEHMGLGHISLVKGHVEDNETEKETALREIKEETSLDVDIDLNFRKVITYSPEKNKIKDVVFFVAKCLNNNQIPVDEHDQEVVSLEFLKFEEAYEKLTYSSDKEVLKEAYNYINK